MMIYVRHLCIGITKNKLIEQKHLSLHKNIKYTFYNITTQKLINIIYKLQTTQNNKIIHDKQERKLLNRTYEC